MRWTKWNDSVAPNYGFNYSQTYPREAFYTRPIPHAFWALARADMSDFVKYRVTYSMKMGITIMTNGHKMSITTSDYKPWFPKLK